MRVYVAGRSWCEYDSTTTNHWFVSHHVGGRFCSYFNAGDHVSLPENWCVICSG